MIYHHSSAIEGTTGDLSEYKGKKLKRKRERQREVAVIEKQMSKWRPDSAAKKKKHMWGCHFLILSSNALWRKFVKLDQWRLKLVYKGVSEGRRRRNVVHLRRLRCLQSARLGGTAPPPPFRVVASAVRCHVFWHFALERMQEKVVLGGRCERGNVRRKQKRLLSCSQNWGQGLFFLGESCSQIVS